MARGWIVAVALLGASPAAAAINLQEGQWRMAVEIQIPNASGPDTGPARHELCLRPDDVSRLTVPPNSPCTISDLVSTDRDMSWKVSCRYGSMRTSGAGHFEFAGDRFKGTIESQSGPPYNMRITQKIDAKRLGPCKFAPKSKDRKVSPLQRYED